eukprot:COSAG06_NODE_6001_length_3161_cov_1.790660_3_plen_86_part_00
MSEGLANSWARHNIAVNVVAPGKKQYEKEEEEEEEEEEDARKLRHVSMQYMMSCLKTPVLPRQDSRKNTPFETSRLRCIGLLWGG